MILWFCDSKLCDVIVCFVWNGAALTDCTAHEQKPNRGVCALLSLEDTESCLIEIIKSRQKQHLRYLGPAHSFSGCLLFVASLNGAALCTSDSVSAVGLGWAGLAGNPQGAYGGGIFVSSPVKSLLSLI